MSLRVVSTAKGLLAKTYVGGLTGAEIAVGVVGIAAAIGITRYLVRKVTG